MTIKNIEPSFREAIENTHGHFENMESALLKIKHAVPFRGEYIRTISQEDFGSLLKFGISFDRLLRYIENELNNAFFKYRDPDPKSSDRLERWKSLGIIETSSEWQATRRFL